MRRLGIAALVILAGCIVPPEAPEYRLVVSAQGPGTFDVHVGVSGSRLFSMSETYFAASIHDDEYVLLEAHPEPGARFIGWSGTHPRCTGDSPSTSLAPQNADIDCTARFGRYTVVVHAPDGGFLEVTDADGETTTCNPADSPCELEVAGDTVTVSGTPETTGLLTVFDPPCPAGPGDECVFDLEELDTDGDLRVEIGASFGDPSATFTLLLDVTDGSVTTLDLDGATESCDSADAPCALEVAGDVVTLEGLPDTAGLVTVFDPPCEAGSAPRCVFYLARLDTDGDRVVSIGTTFIEPARPYTVVLTVAGGGRAEIADGVGGVVSCTAADSPCEVTVPGPTVTVDGLPPSAEQVTVFAPSCPDGSVNRCVFTLADLDADGDRRVPIDVTFGPASSGLPLPACVGLTFAYEEPFGGAMFRVASDGRCEVIRNDGAVLGTFAISGGNGFGGDGSLAIAGIVAESEWLPSGDLVSVLVDGAPAERLEVPPGRTSSQELTLSFTSGMRFVVRVQGTPGPIYTRVTQTVLDARR